MDRAASPERQAPTSVDSTPSSLSDVDVAERSSPETVITEPEHFPGPGGGMAETPEERDDDDIWDTSPSPPGHFHSHSAQADHDRDHDDAQDPDRPPTFHRGGILSDLPALRRQHMTDGYREGLAVGKARVMQSGFDAGYPVGVEVGLRVGNVLGVLEGILAGFTSASTSGQGKMRGAARGKTNANVNVNARGTASAVGTVAVAVEVQATTGESTNEEDSTMTNNSDREPHSLVASRAENASGHQSEQNLQFVQTLYARAQKELAVSELLRGINDATIARIPESSINSGNGMLGETLQAEAKTVAGADADAAIEDPRPAVAPASVALPREIEAVVDRWERVVLGALHG